MTGVPAPKPNLYRPWREIAAELASEKDLEKAFELGRHCALALQSSVPEEKAATSMTEEQLSLALP